MYVWGLSTLSGRTNMRTVIELSVCKCLVELLKHPSPSIVGYALQTIGNLMDDHKAQCFIEYGALPCLLSLLTNNHKTSIKEDTCWAISNFTTGNNEQIQAVIVAGLIAPLVNLVLNGDFEIKKQAALDTCNLLAHSS